MRRKVLLFVSSVLFICNGSFAQSTGGAAPKIYLPGHWLEIGLNNLGAFGAAAPPAAYDLHPYPAGPLASVYDYGHDGWTVGTPALYGDYTWPGTPYEGWGIQVTAAAGLNWALTEVGAISGPGSLTGANTTYSNTAGQLIGNWAGTAAAGQLKINMQTEVDTNASWVVVTAKMYNTGATSLNNIYYFRGYDPDNDETYSGDFETKNLITFQNDADHRVGVRATGTDYTAAFLQLCTKDCRAKAFIQPDWPPVYGVTDLSTLWLGTSGTTSSYALGTANTGDYGEGIIYNIGTLCAGDSTFVSYAYTYLNTPNGIDSAFPEPTIVVNGIPVIPPVAPDAIYDTFNACANPGVTSLPINLTGAATGVWLWSTWTWSPGTGLATTTGLNNTINVYSLPPIITYTITGTPYSGACAGASPVTCGSRIIYLTILTCNGATVNSPCLGDSLIFNAPGDSTGATYSWVGPDSWTTVVSTVQTFTVYPSVWADTGVYRVIKTVGGVADTSTATVVIHPKPSVAVNSNSPLCIGAANTLSLTATPGTVPVISYGWTGPAGFISALQNPTIPGFSAPDTGIYSVIVATSFGCKDTADTHVIVLPPPGPPVVTGTLQYCFGTTFVPLTVTPAFGATVYWYPTAAGGTGSTTPPSVNTYAPGTYTFYYGQTIGLCESPIDSVTIIVYQHIIPNFTSSIARGCTEDTVYFNNTSAIGFTSDLWNFGDGTTSTLMSSPVEHIYVTQSSPQWSVTLTDYLAICSHDTTIKIDTRHYITPSFFAHWDTVCFGQPFMLHNLSTATIGINGVLQTSPLGIASYAWNWGDGSSVYTTTSNDSFTHSYASPGIYNIVLTVTDTIGCSLPTFNENVYVIGYTINSWHDTTLCLKEPLPLTNTIVQDPDLGLTDYTYSWSPSKCLDSDNVQIPYFDTLYDTTTYVLTVNLPGDWGNCKVRDTMTVRAVLGKKLADTSVDATITYGNSYQLNADSLIEYWWVPDNGSLSNPNINNPIATPDTTTTYTVYGMDQYGCVDSAKVTITVDSSMSEFIPTAFTPNNDGLNDYFHPVGIKFQNIVDFRVYNRWGQQVFYTNSASSPGWDGKFNGVPQDMDVYYYTIIVYRPDNGQNVLYKGDVTLIR